jgi:RNA polymerase sigma-70 factor (ECF subfamily)
MSSIKQGNGADSLESRAIVAAQSGDSEGIHYLYVRYAADVRRCIDGIVKNSHEAEDITQSVFTKLLLTIGKYEPRGVPFSAWIMRVARNAALDHLRSGAARQIPSEEIVIEDDGRAERGRERGRDLRAALRDLPEDQREVLVLRHIVGLSPLEIANTLGKTENSVHGLHHRGRRAMQRRLGELGATPVVAGA